MDIWKQHGGTMMRNWKARLGGTSTIPCSSGHSRLLLSTCRLHSGSDKLSECVCTHSPSLSLKHPNLVLMILLLVLHTSTLAYLHRMG